MQNFVTDPADSSYPLNAIERPAQKHAYLGWLIRLAAWYRDLCADCDDAWQHFPQIETDTPRQLYFYCLLMLAGKATLLWTEPIRRGERWMKAHTSRVFEIARLRGNVDKTEPGASDDLTGNRL